MCRCEKAGAYAVISDVAAEEPERRSGARQELEVTLADFCNVLCVRLCHDKHINALECEGLLLWLRWYSRLAGHQNSRLVVLIDSTVVAQAAAKGRSSSCLGHTLRRIAALELATGLVLFALIVPSAHNPADAPSRGDRCGTRSTPRAPPPSCDLPEDGWNDSEST